MTSDEHPLISARTAKIENWRQAGFDPYPVRFDRSHMASALHEAFGDLPAGVVTEEVVSVAGRVMLQRSFGKLIFATIEDWSGSIQLFASAADLAPEVMENFSALDAGDWVGASGAIMTTKKGELSVKVESFQLLAKAIRPLPEKWHGLQDVELRSRRRYIDLMMNPEARQLAMLRSKVVGELRRQFEARGFIEVETPVLQAEPGGAIAKPFETHHNALDIPMYLRIATELHLKRLVVGGLERVFEIGRIFRNEGIDSTHNPEFTTLESYQALADYTDVMQLLEEVLPAVARAAVGTTSLTYKGRPLDLKPPFRRVRMVDLVSEAIGADVDVNGPVDSLREAATSRDVAFEASWGAGKIIEALFDDLVQHELWEPTFVLDHPVEISPLARGHRDSPGLTERFELYIAGQEYADAFSELNDPVDQRRRFESQALAKAASDQEAHPFDEDFIMALEYGLPPTGGLGLGIDRLVMLLADQTHIREVILFPTMRPLAD